MSTPTEAHGPCAAGFAASRMRDAMRGAPYAPLRSVLRTAGVALAISALAIATPTALAAAPPPAPAPLTGAPFEAFTPDDRDTFVTTAMRLAGAREKGTQLRWANDASGAWGTMTLVRTFRSRGAECREARGENTAAGRTDPFRLVMCRAPGKEWRIRSAGPVPRR